MTALEQPRTTMIEVGQDMADRFDRLRRREGADRRQAFGNALDYYEEALAIAEFLPPSQTLEEADALVAEGEAALARGDVVDQDEMFERLRLKYGG